MKKYLIFIILFSSFIFGYSQITLADVDDFYIKNFYADYYLSKDSNGASTLQVTETIEAVFPNINQNHGIERAIPNEYNNHSVDLNIISINNSAGQPWKYTTYKSNNNTVLRIGDPEKYVQGKQTYVIQYGLKNVTTNFNTNDEFYWDINGTEWRVPINNVYVNLTLDSSISSNFNGNLDCFTGISGSTTSNCTISINNNVVYSKNTENLNKYENLSISVGFQPGTFASYVSPPKPWWFYPLVYFIVPIWYVIVPIIVIIWGIKKWQKFGKDYSKKTSIVPQYLPPKGVSLLLADTLIYTKMRSRAIVAVIVDLAVKRYLNILEDKSVYSIELIKDPQSLNYYDKKVINLLFDKDLTVGNKIILDDLGSKSDEVSKLIDQVYSQSIKDGYMNDTRPQQKLINKISGIFIVLFTITLNPIGVISCIVLFIISSKMPARTKLGLEQYIYLEGTKMYMKTAEEERLKMFQGPNTAPILGEKDKIHIIKLYEKLLPIAILYGIEKHWIRQFETLYMPEYQYDWYLSHLAISDSSSFEKSINQFEQIAFSTFNPSTSSSSSSFSGGGSSGGGGGGGGGGGW